jgi:hypothetical protein
MKRTVYPLRLPAEVYVRVQRAPEKRHMKLSEISREIIDYGLPSLPPFPDTTTVVADTWEELGPAPEVDYGKLRAR